MTVVNLELTEEQAHVVSKALDIYSRLGIGQLNMISEMVREEFIPFSNGQFDFERAKNVEQAINAAKSLLGFSPGASLGIGNANVDIKAHRAFEIKKVLDKALVEHQNPTPSFRGVQYDGLFIRYTKDPEPQCTVSADTSLNLTIPKPAIGFVNK